MTNILSPLTSKAKNFLKDTFVTEEIENNIERASDIQPRNSKGMVIGGASQASENNSQSINTMDFSDNICIIRGIQLVEDGGNYMLSVINRLEKGQLLVVDFSESDDENRQIQFHVLWGAVMALHGAYKVLDKRGHLVLFTSSENKIAEDRTLLESN